MSNVALFSQECGCRPVYEYRTPMSEQLNMRNAECHELCTYFYRTAQSEVTTCVCVYFNVLFLKIHHMFPRFTGARTTRRNLYPELSFPGSLLHER
jgi:hypothetical protein